MNLASEASLSVSHGVLLEDDCTRATDSGLHAKFAYYEGERHDDIGEPEGVESVFIRYTFPAPVNLTNERLQFSLVGVNRTRRDFGLVVVHITDSDANTGNLPSDVIVPSDGAYDVITTQFGTAPLLQSVTEIAIEIQGPSAAEVHLDRMAISIDGCTFPP